MESEYNSLIALVIGFLLDQLLGDPEKIPHPIVGFGKLIAWAERKMNRGAKLLLKGTIVAAGLVLAVFFVSFILLFFADAYSSVLSVVLQSIVVFYCLSARTLRTEVRLVFDALTVSESAGRKQLSRIVGRDTSTLNAQQIRLAALETLSENLSDGVVAPLFWYALLGAPGMLAYKMMNTLDSMVGYKNERYLYFGRFAARLDDVANFIPARITALVMMLVSGKIASLGFLRKYGKMHSSPNSGYPEAALAAILNCRFGGANVYFGKRVEKPFIGENNRDIVHDDLSKALKVNHRTEWFVMLIVALYLLVLSFFQT